MSSDKEWDAWVYSAIADCYGLPTKDKVVNDGTNSEERSFNLNPETMEYLNDMIESIMPAFSYEHLPNRLKLVSMPFHELANSLIRISPPSVHLLNAIQKLLEAKDCAIRAAL